MKYLILLFLLSTGIQAQAEKIYNNCEGHVFISNLNKVDTVRVDMEINDETKGAYVVIRDSEDIQEFAGKVIDDNNLEAENHEIVLKLNIQEMDSLYEQESIQYVKMNFKIIEDTVLATSAMGMMKCTQKRK